MFSNNKILIAAFVLIAFSLSTIGCRGKMRVNVKNRKDPAELSEIKSIEIPDALNALKTQFQSRDTIHLTVVQEVLIGAQSFSLFNDSNNKTIIDDIPLDGEALYGLTTTPMMEMILKFHLITDDEDQSFVYGDNILRLLASSDTEERFTTSNVKLYDFDVFGVAATTFDTGNQVHDGFQGWINPISSPVVWDKENNVLTNGWPNIINR